MEDSFTEEAQGGAHNIDRMDELEGRLRDELSQWALEADVEVSIAEMYINGSYGGQNAHSDSDVDVTIGVAGATIDECNRATQQLQKQIGLHDGWWKIDPCVLPVGRYLYGHLEERSEHGGYQTLYDVLNRDYVSVGSLR